MDDLQVSTARGPIGVSDLGVTLMHEHVFLMTTEIMQNYPEDWGDGYGSLAARIAGGVPISILANDYLVGLLGTWCAEHHRLRLDVIAEENLSTMNLRTIVLGLVVFLLSFPLFLH